MPKSVSTPESKIKKLQIKYALFATGKEEQRGLF